MNVGRISETHPPIILVDALRLSTLPDLIRASSGFKYVCYGYLFIKKMSNSIKTGTTAITMSVTCILLINMLSMMPGFI